MSQEKAFFWSRSWHFTIAACKDVLVLLLSCLHSSDTLNWLVPLLQIQFTKGIQNESERKGQKREKEELKPSFVPSLSLKCPNNSSIIKTWTRSTKQWCRIPMPSDPRSNTAIAIYPRSSHSTSQIECHVYSIKKKNHLLKSVTKRWLSIYFLQDSPFFALFLQTLVKIYLCFWERWIVSEATNK